MAYKLAVLGCSNHNHCRRSDRNYGLFSNNVTFLGGRGMGFVTRCCRVCGEEKPAEDFYKDGHGRRNECRFCHSDAVCRRQRANPERYKAYQQKWRETNKRSIETYNTVERHKESGKARAVIGSSVFRGTILRPCLCSVCGTNNKEIHAHHPNYSEPRRVVWLCESCHGEIHRKQRRGKSFECMSVYLGGRTNVEYGQSIA